MGRLRAQGAVEYLLTMALVLIILVWGIYYLRIAKGQHENLADSLSSSEDRFNEKIRSEISSNMDSS
ncbi:hypothetical protein [Thermococcus waiotapuensis]|uniref:Class III signal peptide-containing protein n=1 Tax=Thermococcus waiotapuensis TaxID=90909 RepID=A0AAE4NWU3_9EURY|nr:hypothetical protein [Thermococcus waiotapuensis]MDV3104772.1 hypothetical protein [Thermococcus waiotapuensis]